MPEARTTMVTLRVQVAIRHETDEEYDRKLENTIKRLNTIGTVDVESEDEEG